MPNENNITSAEIRANTVTSVKLTVDNGAITNTDAVFTPVAPPASPPPAGDPTQNQNESSGESSPGSESVSDDNLELAPPISFKVTINGRPATRGRVRILTKDEHYRGPDVSDAEKAFDIGPDGNVSGVVASPGELVVIQAYNRNGGGYSKVIPLTEISPSIPGQVDINQPVAPQGAIRPSLIRVDWGKAAEGGVYRPADWPGSSVEQSNWLINRLINRLFSPGEEEYLSLGRGGRLEIWFSSPIFSLTLFDEKPGEEYRVRLGRAPGMGQPPTGRFIRDVSPTPLLAEQVIQLDEGDPSSQAVNYVEITDLERGSDSTDNPGLDIKQIQALGEIELVDGVFILLDISGSMFRELITGDTETVELADQAVGRPADDGKRLYQYACEAIQEALLPRASISNYLSFYFRIFFLKPNETGVTIFGPILRLNNDPSTLLPGFPADRGIVRARLQVLLTQCLGNTPRSHTPLRSAVENITANLAQYGISRPLIVVITDGIGSSQVDVNGNKVPVLETINNLNLPNNVPGHLELVGFRIPTGNEAITERKNFLSYDGLGVGWRVNSYDARNNPELREILRGIRIKHRLDRAGPELLGSPPPEESWLRDSSNLNIPNTNIICNDIRSKWPEGLK